MTDEHLHEIATRTNTSFEDIKTVHDEQPPEKQNEIDILEALNVSKNETLKEFEVLLQSCDDLQ